MNVSVIIVNYNTMRLTQNCIDSIFEKTEGISFEVILVDNASTDGSKEHFEKDNRIMYVYCDRNLGFGRANNIGFERAKGDYLFFLNSDTLLINNALFEFYSYMESVTETICCVGCELVDNLGKPSYSFGFFPSIRFFLGKILQLYHINRIHSPCTYQGKHPLTVDYSSGADMFIRRKVIEECGLFDPDFFMYFEEVEMQNRFSLKGYHSQIINTPQIIHLLGASETKKAKKSGVINLKELESRYIYCRKVFNKPKYLLMSILHLFIIPRVLLYKILWEEKIMIIRIVITNLFPRQCPSLFFGQK